GADRGENGVGGSDRENPGGSDDQIEADQKGNNDEEVRHLIVLEARRPNDFQRPADQHVRPGTARTGRLHCFLSAHFLSKPSPFPRRSPTTILSRLGSKTAGLFPLCTSGGPGS